MKAVVVYGTRGGATKAIAEEIGKALAEHGYEATVKDARDTKGVDTSKPYDTRDFAAIRQWALEVAAKAQ